jgi:hypothetical protein
VRLDSGSEKCLIAGCCLFAKGNLCHNDRSLGIFFLCLRSSDLFLQSRHRWLWVAVSISAVLKF